MSVVVASLLALGGIVALSAPASAVGGCTSSFWGARNCYSSVERLQARYDGKVQVKASYSDSGRHAKNAYLRYIRDAGPSLDTGRLYTSTATSRSDSTVRARTKSVWDSLLWGDRYRTKFYYGFTWF